MPHIPHFSVQFPITAHSQKTVSHRFTTKLSRKCVNVSLSFTFHLFFYWFYPKISGNDNTSLASLESVISIINENISEFDQKIVEIDYTLPEAEDKYLVFTSTTDSGISKLQKAWKPSEVELFRIMIREIATNEDFQLSLIHCINLASNVTVKITKARAEETIRKWIEMGYFYELDENIYFGPRLLAEFSTTLSSEYKDFINFCGICKGPVFWVSFQLYFYVFEDKIWRKKF